MTLEEWIRDSERTYDAAGRSEDETLACFGLGIAGEAGEVADLIKKQLFHGHPMNRNDMVKELGDVMWYLWAICKNEGIDIHEVFEVNSKKLRQRYPNGFSVEDSIERRDVAS